MSLAAAGGRVGAGALAATAVAIFALSIPLLDGGIPAGHDAPAHLTYTFLFQRALEQGQFPVRWVEWVRDGHAQPLFNFYQPGLYYFVALVHQVVPSLRLSLALTVVFLWWLGAVFVFLLVRRAGAYPAALAASIYAFSPYVILDVFVRSAFPELAAVAFATGVFWALDRLLRAPTLSRLAALALLAALVVVCHPPTALIFSPAFAVYAAYLVIARQAPLRAGWWLLPAGLLAFGLAAFYIVPAMRELHLIKIGRLTTGDFDYRRHFVLPIQWLQTNWGYGGSVEGPNDNMSFQLGLVQLAALVLAAGMAGAAMVRRQAASPAGALTCWIVIAGLSLLLMTDVSAPLWRAVPALTFIQFPWRYLMVTVVAAAVLSAFLLSTLRCRTLQGTTLLVVLVLQVQLTHEYLKPQRYIPPDELSIDRAGWTNAADVEKQAFIEPGYLPRSVPDLPVEDVGRWTLLDGTGSIRPVSARDDEIVLTVETAAPATLLVHSPAFPGWRAWIDGREVSLSRDPHTGYLAIRVPAGHHRVRAAFTDTPVRRRANLTTAASIAACAALFAADPFVRRWRAAPDRQLTTVRHTGSRQAS